MKAIYFLTFILLITTANSCHVGKFFVYNFANLTDYKKFKNRAIKSDSQTFQFINETDTSILFNNYTSGRYTNIAELETMLKKNKTVSFLIIQNDTIKYQWYANKWSPEETVSSFSMSKSMISAMIGIALEERKIKNLNEPITNYIKVFKNEGFQKITIQNLLNMRTGIDYNESYINPFGNVAVGYYGNNLSRHVSNLKIKGPAGEKFEYISIATQLLGMIIEAATEKNVSTYFEEKIWTKIGTEFPASWSLDHKNGLEKSFCCINGATEDFAKFARLYLNLGNWNGTQIISEEWVKKSVQLHENSQNKYYQNQWWLFGKDKQAKPGVINYAAQGHLGQYLFINPTKNLIIVRFGKGYGGLNWRAWLSELSK